MRISSLFKAAGIEPNNVKCEKSKNTKGKDVYVYNYEDKRFAIVIDNMGHITNYAECLRAAELTRVLKKHNILGKKLDNDIDTKYI